MKETMIAQLPIPQSSPFTSTVEAPLASLISNLHIASALKFQRYHADPVILPMDQQTAAQFRDLASLTAGTLFSGLFMLCLLIVFQDYRRHSIMHVSVICPALPTSSKLITPLGLRDLHLFHLWEINGIYHLKSHGTSSNNGQICTDRW